LEKIRGEFQDVQKTCEQSSDESHDESHYEDNERLGAKKKKLLTLPKRAIKTIYTENSSQYEASPSLENGGV
jgi:hypothetical protein